MRVSIISFTENGMHLSQRAEKAFLEMNTKTQMEVKVFTKCTADGKRTGKYPMQIVEERMTEWAKAQMEQRNALLFIGACGIAVRAIAPYVTDKLQDSPVLVMDEKGNYVIPILSGHMGGANELALWLGERLGAVPVITTATDINQKFAVDLFAKKNGLFIVNKAGIAKVSAKVLSGQKITMSVETGHMEQTLALPEEIQLLPYPPTQQVDILVTSEAGAFDTAILIQPREYMIGMGCKRGKEAEKIEDFIERNRKKLGISIRQIAALASIDRKSNEAGFLAWSGKEHIPFLTYTAEELQQVQGVFYKSDFVKKAVGVDNVCERAALKACGLEGQLVYKKHTEDGMTIAIAKRKWRVRFDEA